MADMTAKKVAEFRQGCNTYLINSPIYNYYIIIPTLKQQLRILLDFTSMIDDEQIGKIPVSDNNAIVVPVLDERMVNYLKTTQASYDQAIEYFIGMIRNASGLLTHNKKIVESRIIVNNDGQFNDFVNYFSNKYSGTIMKSNVDLFNRIFNNNVVKEEVVSQVQTQNDKLTSNTDGVLLSDEVYQMTDELGGEQVKGKTRELIKANKGEPGFVSYVLLGVVIAVMSLVFLYMLI